MKNTMKIIGWVLFTCLVLVVLGFVDAKEESVALQDPSIRIEKGGGHTFITEDGAKELLNDLGYSFKNQDASQLELDRIEAELSEVPGVESVEAYTFSNGEVAIEIKQQTPIARVILYDGKMGCYLDESGKQIPLSKSYVAKVPVFSGHIHEPYNDIPEVSEITVNDSIADLHVIDDIYKVAKALHNRPFLKDLALQFYVNAKDEFEMIPRVGNHRILLGKAERLNDKFKRLENFYTSTSIDPREYNMFDTINLKYKKQLVCSHIN